MLSNLETIKSKRPPPATRPKRAKGIRMLVNIMMMGLPTRSTLISRAGSAMTEVIRRRRRARSMPFEMNFPFFKVVPSCTSESVNLSLNSWEL